MLAVISCFIYVLKSKMKAVLGSVIAYTAMELSSPQSYYYIAHFARRLVVCNVALHEIKNPSWVPRAFWKSDLNFPTENIRFSTFARFCQSFILYFVEKDIWIQCLSQLQAMILYPPTHPSPYQMLTKLNPVDLFYIHKNA